jgi:hypothetical protein
MIVTLTIEDVATLTDHGSVVAITGTDEDGQRVTFAGDSREMEVMVSALVIGDEPEVEAEIEDWQIIRPILEAVGEVVIRLED